MTLPSNSGNSDYLDFSRRAVRYVFHANKTAQLLYGLGLTIPFATIAVAGLAQLLIYAGWLKFSRDWGAIDPGHAVAELIIGAVFSMIGLNNLVGLYRGLPVLTVLDDGIEFKTVYSTYTAHWSSFLPVDVVKCTGSRGRTYYVLRAQIIGDQISANLSGKRFLTITDRLDQKREDVARIINVEQSAYFAKFPDRQISLRISKI